MNPNSSSASSSAPPATSSSVNREGSHDRVHWTDEMEDYLVDSLSIHGVYAKKHQKSDKRSKSERLEATKESLLKYPQFSAIGNHSAESLEKHFKDKCKSLLSKLQLNNESLLTVNIEDMRESKFISNTESKYLLLYREWRQQLSMHHKMLWTKRKLVNRWILRLNLCWTMQTYFPSRNIRAINDLHLLLGQTRRKHIRERCNTRGGREWRTSKHK